MSLCSNIYVAGYNITSFAGYLFKLVSGEQIIAYTHNLDDESNGALIGIEEPMKVSVEEDHHYVMTPWLPFSSQTLHVIEDFNIMLTTDVTDDVKAHYMKIILDEIQTDKQLMEEQVKMLKGNATTH